MTVLKKGQSFVYKNARPLDLARWRFHFEDGSAEEVLKYLIAYQNPDGGFGHAIEPDFWNENSTPIATWAAISILREIGVSDKNHPIIKGIINYLESGKNFLDGKWQVTVLSNNDYPHAIWWEHGECEMSDDNPTVSLAGFILRFADKDSEIYHTACEIVKTSVLGFIAEPTDEQHTLRCYMELYDYCCELKDFDIIDIQAFREKLSETVNKTVCSDTSRWLKDYVCTPSALFKNNKNSFSMVDRELAEHEADMMLKFQSEDGSFPITWTWHTDYKEFEISANWWRSANIINNLLYLRYLGRL